MFGKNPRPEMRTRIRDQPINQRVEEPSISGVELRPCVVTVQGIKVGYKLRVIR